MKQRLKERDLFLLHEGDGTAAERAHLAECGACAERYRRLESDLGTITQALRQAPLAQPARSYSFPWTARWATAAVIAAWALVVVWQGIRIWQPATPAVTEEELWTVMEELSPEQLAQNQAGPEDLWIMLAESYERAAALELDRPCEWYDLLSREAEPIEGSGEAVAPAACVELGRL